MQWNQTVLLLNYRTGQRSTLNDGKETVFLEAKLSQSHAAFKPTQTKSVVPSKSTLKKKKVGAKTKNRKSDKTFRRQGTKR